MILRNYIPYWGSIFQRNIWKLQKYSEVCLVNSKYVKYINKILTKFFKILTFFSSLYIDKYKEHSLLRLVILLIFALLY